MSLISLKQNNVLLRSLLKEYESEPITEDDSIQTIMKSLKSLHVSRKGMKTEYERQKLYAEELQRQLGDTVSEYQRCSAAQEPGLKEKLIDLQRKYDSIAEELNVTSSLVTPLQEIVTKGHDELKKCIVREKDILQSLTGEKKAETTDDLKDISKEKPVISQFAQSKRIEGVTYNSEIDVPLTKLSFDQVIMMDAPTLQKYASKYHLPEGYNIEGITDSREKLGLHRQILILAKSSKSKINTWKRAKLMDVLKGFQISYNDTPIEQWSLKLLRKAAIDAKNRWVQFDLLNQSDPELLGKLQANDEQENLKFIRRHDSEFSIDEDADLQVDIFWKALEIAVKDL